MSLSSGIGRADVFRTSWIFPFCVTVSNRDKSRRATGIYYCVKLWKTRVRIYWRGKENRKKIIDQFFTLILRYIYNSRLLNKTMTLSFIKYTRLEMFIGKKKWNNVRRERCNCDNDNGNWILSPVIPLWSCIRIGTWTIVRSKEGSRGSCLLCLETGAQVKKYTLLTNRGM